MWPLGARAGDTIWLGERRGSRSMVLAEPGDTLAGSTRSPATAAITTS